MKRIGSLALLQVSLATPAWTGALEQVDYRLLATNRTSTMERELNEAARDGYELAHAMGGETEHGGRELVAIVERRGPGAVGAPYEYLVLATNRTGTMQKELDDAARRGFVFAVQTVYETAFGGEEVVVIMKRSFDTQAPACEYRLLATNRTGTMDRELADSGRLGFVARGMSVSTTEFGGREVVVVTERCVAP